MKIGLSRNSKAVEHAQMTISAEENRPEGTGGRRLTNAEWQKVKPPFTHYRPEMKNWGKLEYEIAQKFVDDRATGWWYYHDRRFIFEKTEDAILFKMWAKDEPMSSGVTAI